jgi:hypothetical protein
VLVAQPKAAVADDADRADDDFIGMRKCHRFHGCERDANDPSFHDLVQRRSRRFSSVAALLRFWIAARRSA